MTQRRNRIISTALLAAGAVTLVACGDDEVAAAPGSGGAAGGPASSGGSGGADGCEPPRYAFESRFEPGTSSVSHSGQAWRHTAILDLKSTIGDLTDAIEKDELAPAPGVVVGHLDFFFRFDPDNGNQPIGLSFDRPLAETEYDDISTGKDLVSKLAGNDDKTDHVNFDGEDDSPDDGVDWDTSSAFVGWEGVGSPEALIDTWFATIEANAIAHANEPRVGPNDVALPVYVTDTGQDLQQLVQKFLTGAIAFSQGADDYLDDDVEGKGLLAAHQQDEDDPYTSLEHAWDEGFRYFGATHDYDTYTDEEIAGRDGRDEYARGSHDTDCDGVISLKDEVVFGHATNAGKRDLGADSSAPTDFTQEAFDAFVAGRTIIAEAELADTLPADTLAALQAERDRAIEAWEKAIAATVVHYINDTLADVAAMGTPQFDYLAYAKHYSELKGFALSLQFNPRSPLATADLVRLHELVGTEPAAPGGDTAAFEADLREARDLLGQAYGFESANLTGW